MTDITIIIPDEIKEQIEYEGDDMHLTFIMETIDENESTTLSISQWLYLIEYLETVCDISVIEWFDITIESILESQNIEF